MTGESKDLAGMPPADMTGMPPADMTGMPPADMTGMPKDMAMMPPVDMAMMPPADMAMPMPDMAMPADMAMPMPDMTMPADMATSPSRGKVCPDPHWCWESPLPQPNTLNGVWAASPTEFWAVGERGTVLRYSGTTWEAIPIATTGTLYAVWGRSSSSLWVVGAGGTIFYWDGTRFTAQTSGVTGALRAIFGDSSTVRIAGDSGAMLKWTGTSWTPEPTGTTSTITSIWGAAANDVWAGTLNSTLCHFGGTAWTCGAEPGFSYTWSIWGSSKNDVWAVGPASQALHWNGTTWGSVAHSASSTAASVFGTAANDVWMVGSKGSIERWDGTAWKTGFGSGSNNLLGVTGAGPNNLMAVGIEGLVMQNKTGSFVTPDSTTRDIAQTMWASAANDAWIFYRGGKARRYDGSKWTVLTPGFEGYSATGRAANDIWVGTSGGRVARYDGTTWTLSATRETVNPITGIYIAAPDRVYLTSYRNIQIWDGARYTVQATTSFNITSIWGSGANDVWAVGSGCSYVRYNGTMWSTGRVAGCVGGLSAVHGTAANNVWMTSDSAPTAFRWNGTTFDTVTTSASSVLLGVFATPTRTILIGDGGDIIHGLPGSFTRSAISRFPFYTTFGLSADQLWVAGDNSEILSWRP